MILSYDFIGGTDFTSSLLTAVIPAGATTTTVRVPVMNDTIVEGDEMFNMKLNVPSSLGPGIVAGSVTSATGIILDSTSKGYLAWIVFNKQVYECIVKLTLSCK